MGRIQVTIALLPLSLVPTYSIIKSMPEQRAVIHYPSVLLLKNFLLDLQDIDLRVIPQKLMEFLFEL